MSILAAPFFEYEQFLLLRFSIRYDLLCLLAFDEGHHLRRNPQFKFEQSLVDTAKLPHTQALVVNEGEIMPLLIHVAGHQIETQCQFAVGYLAVCQETSNVRLRGGVSRVRLRHEQTTIVDRHVESCITLVHGIKKLLQPIIEGGAEVSVSNLQLTGRLIFNRSGFFSDLPFESFQALFVVATHFTHGQQVAALGIEQEEQAVEERQCGTEEWLEQVVAFAGVQVIQVGRKLSSTAGIDDEAACEVGENIKEDAVFESLS